ncbi:Sporulation protein RMD1 [Diplonema papillatum]|nr:Sporulation protein RMD1 [Diplonema papillatum]|eukprot:gene17614-27120_t
MSGELSGAESYLTQDREYEQTDTDSAGSGRRRDAFLSRPLKPETVEPIEYPETPVHTAPAARSLHPDGGYYTLGPAVGATSSLLDPKKRLDVANKSTGKASKKVGAPLTMGKSVAFFSEASAPVTAKRTKPRRESRQVMARQSSQKKIVDKPDDRAVCVACVCDKFDMDEVKRVLQRAWSTVNISDVSTDSSVVHVSISPDFLRSSADEWGESNADVFIYSYGILAFWGYNEESMWEVIHAVLLPAMVHPIAEYEREVATWGYQKSERYGMTTSADSDSQKDNPDENENARFSWLDNDHFNLAVTEPDVKLAYSFAMAQSEKLSFYEDRIDEQISATRKYPEELAAMGEVALSGKDIAKTKGQLFLHRMNIILHTDLLDTPDYFWERTDLEPLYINARKYFEISRRVRVLNERLGVVAELFDMLHDQQKQKHADRLEWIVIWLIVIELVVALVSLLLKIYALPGPLSNVNPTPLVALQ